MKGPGARVLDSWAALLTVKGWWRWWTGVEREPPGRVAPPPGRTAWTYVCHPLPSCRSSSQSCRAKSNFALNMWPTLIMLEGRDLKHTITQHIRGNSGYLNAFWLDTRSHICTNIWQEKAIAKISCVLLHVSGSDATVHRWDKQVEKTGV